MIHHRPAVTVLARGIMLVAMTLAAACACHRDARIPSFWAKGPCQAPCWQGLVPGESTKQDALEVLRHLPSVDQGSIESYEGEILGEKTAQVTWSSLNEKDYNIARFYRGILIRLEFDANCGVTLGELVERYGSPEGFRMNVGRGGVSLVVSYAASGFEASTEYVSRDISWGIKKSGTLDVQPGLCLSRVYYFEPMPLEQALRRAYLEYNDTIIRRTVAGQQPWQGFGRVHVENWE